MDGGLAVEMPSSPRGRGGSGSEVAIDLPGGSSYLSKCMHIALSRRVRNYVISLVVYYAIGVGFYATGTVQLRQYEIEEEEAAQGDVFERDGRASMASSIHIAKSGKYRCCAADLQLCIKTSIPFPQYPSQGPEASENVRLDREMWAAPRR